MLVRPGLRVNNLVPKRRPDIGAKVDDVVMFVFRRDDDVDTVSTDWDLPPFADNGVPTRIDDVRHIEPVIGPINEINYVCYQTIKAIAPGSNVWMVPILSLSPDTDMDRLVPVVNELREKWNIHNIPLAIYLCPELETWQRIGFNPAPGAVTWEQDREFGFTAIARFAKSTDNLFYLNLWPNVVNLYDANLEAADIRRKLSPEVPNGHVSLFFGWMADHALPASGVPLSTYAAAMTVRLNQDSIGIHPPAGLPTILDRQLAPEFIVNHELVEDVHESQLYNYPWELKKGWAIWGDSTLSTEPGWSDLSVRLSISVLSRWIYRDYNRLLFKPINPASQVGEDTYKTLLGSVCDRAIERQIIRSYEIVRVRGGPGNDQIALDVRAQPYGSIHFVDVNLRGNVHGFTT